MSTRGGPAPTPTNLRILRGDRKSRINVNEPKPRDLPPDKPGWLSPLASAEWDRIAPDLVAMRTVKRVDAMGLAAYCEACARLETASKLVAEAGPIIVDRDGKLRRNPAVPQARDASYEVRMWAREFGFTPSARSPLRIDVQSSTLPAERLLS